MALAHFSLLLAAGLSWTLFGTSTAQVQSGWFRTGALVVFGLIVVSLLAGWAEYSTAPIAALALSAGGAYLAFVFFSLERLKAAKTVLAALSACSFAAIFASIEATSAERAWYVLANDVAGAALLGTSMAAMLLGHYYLTAPWMSLEPLKRLVAGILVAAAVRGGLEACRVFGTPFVQSVSMDGLLDWVFYAGFRWAVGIVGPVVLAILTWQTLKLKATQAATGIMYVIVIFTLIGEVTGVALRYLGGYQS